MAQQFNGTIAVQTAHFRGTSTINIRKVVPEMSSFRSISGAAYGINVTGGVSGSFGVLVLGHIGGITYTLAGLTTVASGVQLLAPATYARTGAENATETAMSIETQQILNLVPPSYVAFQSGVATAGISAAITVTACIRGGN